MKKGSILKPHNEKLQGFFKDSEIRKFSFEEKIIFIFKQVYAILQPVEQISHKRIYYSYQKSKRIKIITCIFNEKEIPFINKIELPFTDISIKTNSLKYIEITGDDFCYKFPFTMMPQIWYRLKKVL